MTHNEGSINQYQLVMYKTNHIHYKLSTRNFHLVITIPMAGQDVILNQDQEEELVTTVYNGTY